MSLPNPLTTKRPRQEELPHSEDCSDEVPEPLLEKLKTPMGSIFSNLEFLELFRNMFFPDDTLKSCAQHIIDSAFDGKHSQLMNLCMWVCAGRMDLLDERRNFVQIFVKLMTAYMQYVVIHDNNSQVWCVYNGDTILVSLTDSAMEGDIPVFFAGHLRLELLHNESENLMEYYATLRKDLRLVICDDGSVSFVFTDITNPLENLGEGSYGMAFKIMGTNGKWYVIKTFKDKRSAKEEWAFLSKVAGKHKCLQHGVRLMTDQSGYFQHFIVSEYQGEMVLSDLKKNKQKKIPLQNMLFLFLEMSKGICVIHQHGFIHGDIKPANIVFSPDLKNLILIDFGIATPFGKNPVHPDSLYTWWFRFPRLFLEKRMMCEFNNTLTTIIHPTEIFSGMDWWAFFVSILHTLSQPSFDFLGFRSMDEDEARKEMFRISPVIRLMKKMKHWLTEERGMNFVLKIYWVLFKSGGLAEFIRVFSDFGVELPSGEAMYNEYHRLFNKWRDENPMKKRVRDIFGHIVCEDPTVDITAHIQELSDLFVEIICDGGDFSIVGVFNTHVSGWMNRLNGILSKMNALNKRIFFY
jgi:serine/threonine protein kinase